MRIQEFMKNNLNYQPSRETWTGSVKQDTQGNFYSYGQHYPLLFKLSGHWFVNTAGYSNTTARHIAWAWSAVDYNATAIELDREATQVLNNSYNSEKDKIEALLKCADDMVERAQKACDEKKRKDTQVYKYLADTLGQAMASQIAVKNLLKEQE